MIEIIEQCQKRIRPRIVTPMQENGFYKMWLEAKASDDARDKFMTEYECDWPKSPIEGQEE